MILAGGTAEAHRSPAACTANNINLESDDYADGDSAAVGVEPTPDIPTLSEWGLLLFAARLAGLGCFFVCGSTSGC